MRFIPSLNRGLLVTSGIWAKVGGLISAVAVTAAAQLWEFAFPRALLLTIAIPVGCIALLLELWTSVARALLSPVDPTSPGEVKNNRNEIAVGAALMVILAYAVFLIVYPIAPAIRGFMECARFSAPEECMGKVPTSETDAISRSDKTR